MNNKINSESGDLFLSDTKNDLRNVKNDWDKKNANSFEYYSIDQDILENQNEINMEENEESDDSYAAQFNSTIRNVTTIALSYDKYEEFIRYKKNKNFVGGGLFRVLFLTSKSLKKSQSSLTESDNYDNVYVFLIEIKQFKATENIINEFGIKIDSKDILVDWKQSENNLQYWFLWQ